MDVCDPREDEVSVSVAPWLYGFGLVMERPV